MGRISSPERLQGSKRMSQDGITGPGFLPGEPGRRGMGITWPPLGCSPQAPCHHWLWRVDNRPSPHMSTPGTKGAKAAQGHGLGRPHRPHHSQGMICVGNVQMLRSIALDKSHRERETLTAVCPTPSSHCTYRNSKETQTRKRHLS